MDKDKYALTGSGDVPLLGKTLQSGVVTETLKVSIEEHAHSWDLLAHQKDGTVGVICTGPIQSLGGIMQILAMAGAKPQRVANIGN